MMLEEISEREKEDREYWNRLFWSTWDDSCMFLSETFRSRLKDPLYYTRRTMQKLCAMINYFTQNYDKNTFFMKIRGMSGLALLVYDKTKEGYPFQAFWFIKKGNDYVVNEEKNIYDIYNFNPTIDEDNMRKEITIYEQICILPTELKRY